MMRVHVVAVKNLRNAMDNSKLSYDSVPPLSDQAKNFRPGIYRHYKGDLYNALFVARSSEARDEEFVVYQSLEKGLTWVRPLAMFLEDVEIDSKKQPRFEWVRKKV